LNTGALLAKGDRLGTDMCINVTAGRNWSIWRWASKCAISLSFAGFGTPFSNKREICNVL
jgi:hypothetical protein